VTGVVFELAARAGEAVVQGQSIVIVESMKMEIAIVAPSAGQVSAIMVEVGQPIDEGQIIAVIQT
jgi:biotin carboxyl carrier protein